MSKAELSANRNPSTPAKEPLPAPVFKAPLKPRRGLFFGLIGLLTLWMGALVVLYAKTVYPTHHQHTAPANEPTAVEKTVAR